MLADLALIAGLLAAVAATLAWLALVVSGLSRTGETRVFPWVAWLLLCLFSPVGAVGYLIARWAWRRRPVLRRGG